MIGTLSRPLPKRQIWRLLAVHLSVVLVLIALPIRTSYREYQQVRSDAAIQERLQNNNLSLIQQARQAERDRPAVLGEVAAALDMLQTRTRRIPSPEEWAEVVQGLRDLVQRARLDLISLQFSEPEVVGAMQVRTIRLRAEGNFALILTFLRQLRTNHTLFLIDALDLRSTASATRPPRLVMEVGLRTVFAPEPPPLSSVADMLPDIDDPPDGEGAEAP